MLLSNINQHSSFLLATGPRVLVSFFSVHSKWNTYLLNTSLINFQSAFSHWEVEHMVLRYLLQVRKGVIEGLLSEEKKY